MGDIADAIGFCCTGYEFTTSPEEQFADDIAKHMTPPKSCILDEKIHRFWVEGDKTTEKTGWYVGYPNGIPAGAYGNWRADINRTWRAGIGRELNPYEILAHQESMAKARAARQEEEERNHAAAAVLCAAIWGAASPADPAHPYLARKEIKPHKARQTEDGRVIIPMCDSTGLTTLQYIDESGGKIYHCGGKAKGSFSVFGFDEKPKVIYVLEGFATAASCYEAMGEMSIAAFTSSNIPDVVGFFRMRYGPAQKIIVVADNDVSGVGLANADRAARKYGAHLIEIPILGDANDYVCQGHDLKKLLNPDKSDWLISAASFFGQPAPVQWLIKRWLQRNSLIMLHGASGCGKTFIALDMVLRIASGMPDWAGMAVAPGPVVYLAGEGHHGIKGRGAAWMQHNEKKDLQFWISSSGCDLNQPTGYERAAQSIRELPIKPVIIVVDTLHRFLAGDENSSMDARGMLDAFARLMFEFSCSVLVVHHVGLGHGTDKRARGSSAWKGALEIEINASRATKGGPIKITQQKSKDSEEATPLFFAPEMVMIDGWVDDDGEPVGNLVLVPTAAPEQEEEDSVARDPAWVAHARAFEQAWFVTGCEIVNELPYVTSSGLKRFLVSHMALKESSAAQAVKPSVPNKLVGFLLANAIIKPESNGWIVVNETIASKMLISR